MYVFILCNKEWILAERRVFSAVSASPRSILFVSISTFGKKSMTVMFQINLGSKRIKTVSDSSSAIRIMNTGRYCHLFLYSIPYHTVYDGRMSIFNVIL